MSKIPRACAYDDAQMQYIHDATIYSSLNYNQKLPMDDDYMEVFFLTNGKSLPVDFIKKINKQTTKEIKTKHGHVP